MPTHTGTDGNDWITPDWGGSGNPLGDDTIYGQKGDDTLSGGAGNDVVYGGDGNDSISNYYTLQNRFGDDRRGDYFFQGGSDDLTQDFYYGEGGNDVIRGVGLSDIAEGGDGDDVVWLVGAGAANGGAGRDVLNSNFARGSDPSVPNNQVILDLRNVWSGGVGYVQANGVWSAISGFETFGSLWGSNYDDIMWIGDLGGEVWGQTGNDLIFTGTGNDTVHGDEGDASVWVYDIPGTLGYAHGNDVIEDAGGNNSLYGDYGNDTIIAGKGNDLLDGGEGNDDLTGGGGTDTLIGGGGNDTFRVSSGTVSISAGSGSDRVIVRADYDTLTITSTGAGRYTIRGTGDDGAPMIIDISDGGGDQTPVETQDRTIWLGATTASENDDLLSGTATGTVSGGGGDDIIVSGAPRIVTSGGAADLVRPGNAANTSIGAAISLDALFDISPNSNIENATTVPHATVVSETATGGLIQVYSFTVGAAGIRGVFDIDGANFDTTLRLYNSAGLILAFNDDQTTIDTGSTAARDSYIAHTFAAPGTYYIAVEAYQNAVLGSAYQLHVSIPGHAVVPSTDEIIGTPLDGGTGADVMTGSIGNDRIEGGSGVDTVVYSAARSNYTVTTTGGITTVSSTGFGVDTLTGVEFLRFSDGVVSLTGGVTNTNPSAGADFLLGGGVSDRLDGGVGEDVLFGYAGDDEILGGAGNDLLNGGLGADLLNGGTGFDTASYADAGGGVIIDLVNGARSGEASGDSYRSIEAFSLTAFGDVFVGSANANTISGGGGDDTLTGGMGADVLTGGTGADRFVYAATTESAVAGGVDLITDFQSGLDRIDLSALGAVSLSLQPSTTAGRTTLRATTSSGANLVVEIAGAVTAADVVHTAAVGLTLNGTASADRLVGSFASDVLTGGGGADTLTGGFGADTFRYLAVADSTAAVSDTIADFETGIDRIDLSALNPSSISVARLAAGSVVFAETPTGAFQLFASGASLNVSDFVFGGAFGVYVIGSSGIDVIVGGARPDPLVGNGGDDTITGGGGADAIAGGAGRDVFRYVSVADSNPTGGFDNLYDFVTGEDRIDLSALAPTSISMLRSDNGSSFVYAETAAGSFLTTAAGRAINGTDFIYSGGFGIYMVGSGVADTLIGTSLADPIAGGAGNDTITGGGGADAMFGDAGADTFVYVAASDSTAAATDGIFGFVSGQDRLDLRPVRTGAADTFGIAYLQGGSFLFVDLGGNGSTDMVIGLAGTTLVASDILWATGAIGEEPAVKDAGPQILPGVDEIDLFDTDMAFDLSPHTGRYLLDLEGARGFHGQDWYL